MNVDDALAQIGREWPSTEEAEQRLLDFVGALIIDVARNHPRVTQQQVALWLARIVVGRERKASR